MPAPRPTRPRSWWSWARPKRLGSLDHHDRGVGHVDADLDHRRRDEEPRAAGGEVGHRRVAARRAASGRGRGRCRRRGARRRLAKRSSAAVISAVSDSPTSGADPVGLPPLAERAAAGARPPRRVRRRRRGRSRRAGGPAGFSSRMERSMSPYWASASERGIGVAVITRTSTAWPFSARSMRWRTPKRCCSSTTTRRRSWKSTSFWKQRVGADDDVDLAGGQRRDPGPALAALVAAGEDGEPDARGLGERGEGEEVLAGEDLGRGHHRRLAAGLDRGEHGEERDEGLAGADVALEEAVHAQRRGHVGGDLRDRAGLGAGRARRAGRRAPSPGGARRRGWRCRGRASSGCGRWRG